MSAIHWLNPISGSFTNASDWSGGAVPGASDDAIFDAAGVTPYTVDVSTTATVTSIQTAANATLTIGPTAQFTVTDGTGAGANAGTIVSADTTYGGVSDVVFVVQGVVKNTGLIQLGSSLGFGILDVRNSVTLTGGGQVVFDDAYSLGYIEPADPSVDYARTLFNVDNTISGGGEIVSGSAVLNLVNEAKGVIVSNAQEMFIASAATTNQGLIEAAGAGSILFYADTVSNAGGTILASGGQIYLDRYVDIIGGVLQTTGAGVIYSQQAATLDGQTSAVQNEGLLRFIGATPDQLSADLTLRGQIINTGVIEMNQAPSGNGSAQDRLIIATTNVTLSGGGAVMLQDNPNSEIVGATSASTLTNVDNTVSGAGQVGAGLLMLVNAAAGVIDATGSVNALILDTGANTLANAGLIEATGRGGLVVRNTSVDDASGGVILAGNGSHVALQGADLIGGALESVGSGEIKTYLGGPSVLDGAASAVHNQARVVVQNSTALTIQGAIVNSARVGLTSSGAATTLAIGAAGATLSGGGAVITTNNANNIITGANSAATLTNVDNTIDGAGQLGAGSLTLINEAQGVIVGPFSAALVIDTDANTITNAGRIVAKGAGGVTIQSVVANSGLLEAAGGVLTVNGAVSGTGVGMIYAGTLDFTSSFSQNVVFQKTTGVLELARSSSYSGTVFGFSKTGGTSLDLRDIGFVSSTEATFSGTASGGVLTVTDGAHTAHITLRGDYRASTFTASSDGHGGTIVVDPAAISTTAAQRFVAAAAGLRAGGGGLVSVGFESWRAQTPTLGRPAIA